MRLPQTTQKQKTREPEAITRDTGKEMHRPMANKGCRASKRTQSLEFASDGEARDDKLMLKGFTNSPGWEI